MGSKKSLYSALAAFTTFCSGVPGFPSFEGSGKYPKSYNQIELGKGMSSEEMGTKGKKKSPKSKRNKHHKNKTKSKLHDKCYKKTAPVQQILFYKEGIK